MKKVFKITGYIAVWILLGISLAVPFSFTSREMAEITCSEIAIRYAGDPTIRLSPKELTRLIKLSDNKIIGKKLAAINTEKIEGDVARNKTILRADAYKTVVRDSSGLKGVVTLKVKHRIPRMRVFSSRGNYYMDDTGHKIPVSPGYAADVPVVTGNIGDEMAQKELLPFVKFIQGNKFWKAQIKQIHVNDAGEILLTTLVGGQLVEFGTATDMDVKFRNLRAFYDQVLAKNNWNKYNRIILKFNNQVIAKKNR